MFSSTLCIISFLFSFSSDTQRIYHLTKSCSACACVFCSPQTLCARSMISAPRTEVALWSQDPPQEVLIPQQPPLCRLGLYSPAKVNDRTVYVCARVCVWRFGKEACIFSPSLEIEVNHSACVCETILSFVPELTALWRVIGVCLFWMHVSYPAAWSLCRYGVKSKGRELDTDTHTHRHTHC